MNTKVYTLIDNFLSHLKNQGYKGGDAINFDLNDQDSLMAVELMRKYDLVKIPENRNKWELEYSFITPAGIGLVSSNIGSEKYITDILNKNNISNELELSKLKGDVELLKYSIKNARDLPWQFWITLALSVFAIAISILAYCKK